MGALFLPSHMPKPLSQQPDFRGLAVRGRRRETAGRSFCSGSGAITPESLEAKELYRPPPATPKQTNKTGEGVWRGIKKPKNKKKNQN